MTTTIKTLADLRRIPVGTKLRLVHSPRGPVDQLRTVDEVTTRGIWMQIDGNPTATGNARSWLAFPKAADFRSWGDGFEIRAANNAGGDIVLRYAVE